MYSLAEESSDNSLVEENSLAEENSAAEENSVAEENSAVEESSLAEDGNEDSDEEVEVEDHEAFADGWLEDKAFEVKKWNVRVQTKEFKQVVYRLIV